MSAIDQDYGTLLNAVTATNGAPTDGAAPTQGVVIPQGIDEGDLVISGTASGGTVEVTLRLWGYEPTVAKWFPGSAGTGVGDTVNTQGWLNDGQKLEAIAANVLKGYEPLFNLSRFTRLYLQVVAISGTGTAVTATVIWRPRTVRG